MSAPAPARDSRNEEPRTGLSMGEHCAIMAADQISRSEQDALTVASHHNPAAAYERGFFEDPITPTSACDGTRTCGPTLAREAGRAEAGLRRAGGHDDRGQLGPASDGASARLLACRTGPKSGFRQSLACRGSPQPPRSITPKREGL